MVDSSDPVADVVDNTVLQQVWAELPGLDVRWSAPPHRHHSYVVAHCCQTVYITPDQPLHQMVEAALAGGRTLRYHTDGAPPDQLAERRRKRNRVKRHTNRT